MRFFVLLLTSLLSFGAQCRDIVHVGVYDFPPYAFVGHKMSGISVQLLSEMNNYQDDYEFVLVPTTSKRRYLDFTNNKFDLLLFESKEWGWQSYGVNASKPFVIGSEVYVSRAEEGRGQDFFGDFKNKAMIGVLGYHYQFANFNADHDYLEKHFNLVQTEGQQKSLDLILKGRGDIAVISKEYLNYHFFNAPQDKEKLLVSEIHDQIYQHTVLVRDGIEPTVEYINNLLQNMQKDGVLSPLWRRYGLTEINQGL